MDSALSTVGLPIALGIIMFGLGLSLTPDDFRRVARHPKAVTVALACQLVVLPVVCFGLVTAFDLDPLLAVGMLLLLRGKRESEPSSLLAGLALSVLPLVMHSVGMRWLAGVGVMGGWGWRRRMGDRGPVA